MINKIVLIRSNPVAPEPKLEKYGEVLSNSCYDLTILSWDRKSDFPKCENKNFGKIYRINTPGEYAAGFKNAINILRWNIVVLFWLIKNNKRYEIIHACDFDTIIPALICKLVFRKKVIYDIFDLYSDMLRGIPNWLRAVIRKVDLFLIGFADAVILADESRVKQIKGSRPKKLIFIYNSVPEELLTGLETTRKTPGSLIIGYVGLLQFERGLISMISVVKKHSNWKLILAGYGAEEEKIRGLIDETDNIELLGRVNYDTALKIYANSDVVFATYDPSIPNHRYSSANKLFEAMALGKPIIVAHNTGMDKLVEKYNLGFVVDYGATSQLENVLKEIEDWNDSEAEQFGKKVKEIYKKHFSWEIMKKRLIKLYSEL
jgi:glycosyltransferase involved in cell wall biosynthesis